MQGTQAGIYGRARRAWREYLCGERDMDKTNLHVAKRLERIGARGARAWEIAKEHGPAALTGVGGFTESRHMTAAYRGIFEMALSYGAHTPLCGNPALAADIVSCMDWMYENICGEKEKNGVGWRSTSDFNWWDWIVASPKYIADILILLEREDKERAGRYFTVFDHLQPDIPETLEMATIVTRAYNIVGASLLGEDAPRLLQAVSRYEKVFTYVDKGAGFYRDGSLLLHGSFPYNGHYGTYAVLNKLMPVLSVLAGTPFQPPAASLPRLAEWLEAAYLPLMRSAGMMGMVRGRTVTTSPGEQAEGAYVVTAMLDLIRLAGGEIGDTMRARLKAQVSPETAPLIYPLLNPGHVGQLARILEDGKPAPAPAPFSKVYHNMDRVAHHRARYGVGIAMSSARIPNYECINGNNLQGWYTADGMVYLYTDDAAQYDLAYWEGADPYKRPGVTADVRPREAASILVPCSYRSAKRFVGGVTDGRCTVAAMELESFHNSDEGKDVAVTPTGGPAPLRDCTLTAKKAWFLFDDEAVALGADITAHDDAMVITALENRKRQSGALTVDGRERTVEKQARLQNVKWIYMEGTGGYMLPRPRDILAGFDGGFLTLWTEHGVNPQKEDYVYVMLPAASARETEMYGKAPRVRILRNTGEVQAVSHPGLCLGGAVLWKEGAFGGIAASHPLLIMVKGQAGGMTLSVADPTHELTGVEIRLSASLAPGMVPREAEVSRPSEGETLVRLNLEGLRGASVTVPLLGDARAVLAGFGL